MTPSEAYSKSSQQTDPPTRPESSPESDTPPEAKVPARTSSPNPRPTERSRRVSAWRLRASAAVLAGRLAGATARRLGRGGGTSLPGLVARRLDPAIATYLSGQLRHGSVVITGTNGKTTTSGLTASVLRASGMRVWRNREGANLVRGVSAALIIRARPTGRLRWGGNAAAVFEVDEAAFPQVVAEIGPRAIVVTNLFRDQLDRYGEVDTVAERWRGAIKRLPSPATLVLNADDPAIAALAEDAGDSSPLFFGVESSAEDSPSESASVEVVDTRVCPRCRAALSFSRRFYSHIGHWTCDQCGLSRPQPAVAARDVIQDGLTGTRFVLVTQDGECEVTLPLPGLYNVYNALAAVAAGLAMGATFAAAPGALARFAPAFGRAERIIVGGRQVQLLLVKNPTGLNQVLKALTRAGGHPHLLLLLNDQPADGEDVSWVWDADFEQIAVAAPAFVTAGGARAYDLALRLKYAGAPADVIEPDIARALASALDHTPAGETLYIAPTYTALLAVRGELERQGHAPRYWEQRDV